MEQKPARTTCVHGKMYYYRDNVLDTDGRKKRIYANTEGELLLKLKRIEEARARLLEDAVPSAEERLNVFIDYYYRYYSKDSIAELSTHNLFKRAVFDSALDKPVKNLTKEILEKNLTRLTRTYKVERVQKMTDTLYDMFVKVKMNDKVEMFPLEIKDLNPTALRAKSYQCILTPKEFDEMLDFCLNNTLTTGYGDNLYVIILSMLTGFVFSVVCKMKLSDFKMEEGWIRVIYEGEEYSAPLTEQIIGYLEEFKLRYPERFEGKEDAYLFMKNGELPLAANVNTTVAKVAARLGLPDGITSKCLQKSFIVKNLKYKTSNMISLCERLNISKTKIMELVNDFILKNL